MGVLRYIVNEVLEKSRVEDPPSFEEICNAGRSMGLDPQDIIRLSKVSKASRIRSFAAKHAFIFVLIAAIIYLGLLITVSATYQTQPQNTYPAGARYGVISIRDFRKRGSLEREKKDSASRLARIR